MSTPAEPERDISPKKESNRAYYIFLVTLMIFILGIRAFVAELYLIPSSSMAPTLHGNTRSGDRVLVNKVAYAFNDPEQGDVVVFKAPDNWSPIHEDDAIIKRVIATGGQTVKVNDEGNIVVDDQVIDEPYLGEQYAFEPNLLDCDSTPRSQRCFPEFTVPQGEVWVMGDNRKYSMDSAHGCRGIDDESRCQGTVPEELIIGRAERVIFPFSHGKSL